jgi:ElaB/YqjD/DUF883 family membrane-anchored ribosome-binding protein
MSGQIEGTGAAAVGAHSKDAVEKGEGRRSADQGWPEETGRRAGASGGSDAGNDTGSARAIADGAIAAATHAGASAADMAKSAGEGISRTGRQVYRQGAQTGEYMSDLVRSDPLLAILGAGVVGFALGVLIGRR